MRGMETRADTDPAELAASLEHAAAMARMISTTTDPSHLQQIYNSLTSTHYKLSTFLSLPYRFPPDENSDESAINADPMQVVNEIEEEEECGVRNSKSSEEATMMDEVEEKMRENLFIRNKRPKRAISPSSVAEAERRRLYEYEDGETGNGIQIRFDPNATRLRNLELIHQFHC